MNMPAKAWFKPCFFTTLAALLAGPPLPARGASGATNDSRWQNFDPSSLVRFATAEQAEAKRQELIRFIWSAGLPTNTLPTAATNIGTAVFSGDLSGINGELAVSVDRLEANVAPYDFSSLCYLVHPRQVNSNNRRMVIVNSGHRGGRAFTYGVNDAANRFLSEGFKVLMTDMPMVGFNTNNTIRLPNGGGTVTVGRAGTGAHNELFAKVAPAIQPGGAAFRFFLEPMIQGVNYFLKTTPSATDVAFVGLSGGGWSAHMVAAVDTRIRLSFPVAGSFPLYCRPPGMSHDAEQFFAPLYGEADANGDGLLDTAVGVASWLEIYALGGFGPARRQIQILNLYDSCCFSGDAFKSYTNFVSTTVRSLGNGEWDFYSDSSHSNHLISPVVLNGVIMPGLAR